MEIILTHEQADFDAAGSVLAAWLLDPSRVPILPKRRNRNLAAFVEDHKDDLPFVSLRTLPKGAVSRIYITDTQNIASHKRIKSVSDVIVWDHHPHRHIYPDRPENIYENTGACTTFLVEKLAENPDIHPESLHATLMLMGIYEDTGFLSYGSTTPRDIRAAAWLVEHGADLDLMRRYVLTPLTEHQQQACDLLMKNCEACEIRKHRILVAEADVREISDEFSAVAHHMRDLHTPDGLILLLGTKSGVRVICRGETDSIDFGAMMKQFGGGGHTRAASALIPVEDAEQVNMTEVMDHWKVKLLQALPDHIHPLGIKVWEKLIGRLESEQRSLIEKISNTALQMHMPVYIVGGVVRDLLLERPMMDFDIVVEGDAICLGRQLVAAYGGNLTVHHQFLTAKWELPDGTALDLISARAETYEAPGVLPAVTPGDMDSDLKRRDFTINTLAIRLDGETKGELLDRCGGLEDLRNGLIRILHERSFIDDPTRMFRAVRFEQRFDFTMEPDTLCRLREQLDGIENLTGQRIWHELELYCTEPEPAADFERITQLGIAARIHPGFVWSKEIAADAGRFCRTRAASFWKDVCDVNFETAEEKGLLWIWLGHMPAAVIAELEERLLIPKKIGRIIEGISELLTGFPEKSKQAPSEIVFFLDELPMEALYCYMRFCGKSEGKLIKNYMTYWRHIHPVTTGDDLAEFGIEPGPGMRVILKELRAACIDMDLQPEEESEWLEKSIGKDL